MPLSLKPPPQQARKLPKKIPSVPAALFHPRPLSVVGVAVLCNTLLLTKDDIDDTDRNTWANDYLGEEDFLIFQTYRTQCIGEVIGADQEVGAGGKVAVPGLSREESDTMVFALEFCQAKLEICQELVIHWSLILGSL